MPHAREITPAADYLADAGRFLYGDGWIGPLAADLGIEVKTISGWLKGARRLRGDHPVVKRALGLITSRLQQQEQAWRARVEDLEEEAVPDAPANDTGFPPKAPVSLTTEPRMAVAPAKVRRHK